VQGAAASAHTRLIFLADGSTPYGSNVEVGVNFDSGRSSGIVVMAGSGIARKVLTRTTTLGAAVKSDVQTAKTTAATAAPAVTTSAPFTPSSRRPDRRPHRRRRRRARRARGFSLLEVLMASILFLTSLAGLLSGMQTLLNIEEHQRRLTLGSRIGQAEMERALLLAPCVTPSAGTTDTCLETKAKFYSKDGSLLTAAASDGFRVDRSVANPGTAGVPDGLRRIDIVVGWSETAGRRDVGFSTYRP
jgi:type II secretory pathway pseudopilin PulG